MNEYYKAIKMWQQRGISNKQMMVIGSVMNECLDKCDAILKELQANWK